MQTIEEYKEYTKQLEGEVKQWHDAFDASQAQVKELTKENLRLERERVEQNSIIETCANELEELRLHEVEWDLAKARIKELEESQRWRKFPDEKPEWGKEVIVVDDASKQYIVRFSYDMKWISWGNMNTCESKYVKYWNSLPSAPKEADK